jgi:hypothetical protein
MHFGWRVTETLHRNTSLTESTMFNRNESRGEGTLLVRKLMLNWWLNRSWTDRHKAGTNSVLQNRPRWQILTGKWSLASLVSAGLAKSVTNGAFCGVKSRFRRLKSHRHTLNRVVPFHCAIPLEESRGRGGGMLSWILRRRESKRRTMSEDVKEIKDWWDASLWRNIRKLKQISLIQIPKIWI